MYELELKMEALKGSLQTPLKNQIDHKHHLHKGMWLVVVLFFVSIFFFYEWMDATNNKKQFEENDIKYRAPKVTGDKALLKLLYHTDSLYNLDPEHMHQWVVQEEDQLSEREKCFRLLVKRKMKRKGLKNE